MNKGIKKGLKITGIVIVALLLLMILVPILFKGKIKEAVVKSINENINAKVEINDFGLNLFSHFPKATLTLNEVTVSGMNDFTNDTLLEAKAASVTIDLSSLFGNNYRISQVNLDNVSILAKVLEDGRANYLDIIKNDSVDSTKDDETNNTPFKLDMQKISLKSCNVIYQNDSTKMKISLVGWNGQLTGDLSASETTIKTTSTIDEVSFVMDGIPYLNKVKGTAIASIKADLDNMKFSFIDSNLKLNDLSASINGSIAMVGADSEGIDFDLKLNAPNTQFKDILSIVPAMYTKDFKNVKTSGNASIDAYVKGLMQDETYPAFDVKINVADAMFQYPSLPKSLNNINVNIAITNEKQGSLDNMIIDINKFSFNLGGNPFAGGLKITKPMSDPNLSLHANGILDLGMIKDVYPLEKGTELNGKIVADLQLATALSYTEKEQYDKISAAGHLAVNNMIFKSKDAQDIQVNNAKLEFTPKYANLSSLNVKVGKNDINADGRLENFIGYAMTGQTLKGQLNLTSNYLNLNDFMGGEAAAADTTSSSSDENPILPKNIDFTMNAKLKQVIYEKINITDLIGSIGIKNGILSLNNVGANALGGSAKINGKYDTSDGKTAKANFTMNLDNVSFAETFKSVMTIQKLAPIFENIVGTYSMNLDFKTQMGTMEQILHSLSANGGLKTNNVKLENVEVLNKLSSALKSESLKTISPKDLNIPFSVNDGKITTKPFSFNFSDGGVMKLEGTTSLAQEIDYKGNITLPKNLSNDYVKNVGIKIGGTFKDPKISIDAKSLAGGAVDAVAEKLLGTSVLNKSEEDKAKQAQDIRDEAKKVSDKLIAAAQEQSDNLVKNAGDNKLAQVGAKAAGKKLVDEAKKQGQKLIDEAEKKAKQIEGASPSDNADKQ